MPAMKIVPLSDLQQFQAVELLLDPGHIPGPKIAPNCVEVRWRWSQADGKLAFNVTHARYTPPYPGTVTLANAIQSSLVSLLTSAALDTALSTSTSFLGVDLRDINAAGFPLIASTGAAHPGTRAEPPMPNEIAAALTLRTQFTGQGNRGRIFLPGFGSNLTTANGVIDAATKTILDNFANGVMAVYTSNALTMAIAKPARAAYTGSTGRAHPARAASTEAVTSVICRDNHWDTQRRRGLK
jgi:hypothetical protein